MVNERSKPKSAWSDEDDDGVGKVLKPFLPINLNILHRPKILQLRRMFCSSFVFS